ncbi:anaphase-promoting complex subunit 4 isoform X1 [Canna indica]|uniref:Anaphase-promoting complex subunit 4 n=1 Tax=Canna indica TaxID=4628 RepID=A0AAQ3KCY5_9LILI|nr:anaphase-promoting complex subunit 4 isoform X1 [Canna indica]
MAEPEEEVEMESDAGGPIPFQLQLDKPLPFQIRIAEWNPEKDLLAMVTEDSKVVLHRFNWQRLWMITPGKCITSLCWRPDGKVIALGLEDGSIVLHDVENGKLLRSIKSHSVAVICLNWEEDKHIIKGEIDNAFVYEDRTSRFFPPGPKVPRMPGLAAGDAGFMDDHEDTFHELSTSPSQRFNMLSSGDKDGCIYFSIFGIFPIGKINIHQLSIRSPFLDKITTYQLLNASIHKLALSKDLSQLVVLSFGELIEDLDGPKGNSVKKDAGHADLQKSPFKRDSSVGFHCLLLNTSIFLDRKNELHQVAQQASSIEDLVEVVCASLSVMSKQWSEAMHSFHEKFDSLSSLIVHHGLDSNPQDEFLSILFGARTSPPLHQFLVNSLGEAGLKRVSKAVHNAGKELHSVVHEHLQPAVEIMGFRIAELRGLSRWRARYRVIGLDEKLMDSAIEKVGMLHVQLERLLRILAIVLYQFQNFFSWVMRSIKTLMSEPIDQIHPVNSELVVTFLKFLLNHDPVGELLDANKTITVDANTMEQLEELIAFGGYSNTNFLERTLSNEFNQLNQCLKETFLLQFTTISQKIHCEDLMPLYEFRYSPDFSSSDAPTSIFYYKGESDAASEFQTNSDSLVDYVCFKVPEKSLGLRNCIGIVRGFTKRETPAEALLLCIPHAYHCIDLSFYKENQIVLLLNEATSTSEGTTRSVMMMVQVNDRCFLPLSRGIPSNLWALQILKPSSLHLEDGKVRHIPDPLTSPLAVSASRGLACVFSSRRHAMVYILDEDEDEASDID